MRGSLNSHQRLCQQHSCFIDTRGGCEEVNKNKHHPTHTDHSDHDTRRAYLLLPGTLVSDRHVVTAAHCLTRLPRLVRLGDSDLTKEYDCLEPGQCQG